MADNTFVTRLLIETVGMDAAIQKMKDAGATQKEITKYVKEYNDAQKRASAEELAGIQKVNAALKENAADLKKRATALSEVSAAAAAAGNIVKPTSYGQMLRQDINTSDFARYQSEVSALSAKMKDATSPAEIQAYEIRLASIAQKYGQINVEAAKLAGINREVFVKGIDASQYVAISNAIQKLKAEQAGMANAPAVDKLGEAHKRFEQIVQQTRTPVERLKQQLRDLQTFKSNLPDDFKATDQQAQALHRRFVDLNAQLKELNKPADPKAPFMALMRQYDPQFAVQQREARSAQIMAGVGAGAYDLATAERMNKALMEQTKHLQEVSTKGKVNTNQMLQYTAAIRNTAESLASGMSPATVAMTQGMQVLGAYMGENIGLMARLGIVAGVAAVTVGPLIAGLARAAQTGSQAREIEATSIAYRNMAVSVNDAAESLRRMAENSKFSRDEALSAVKELTKMRNLSPDVRQGIMGSAGSFATVTGQDVGPAAKQLGEAFGGSFEGIRKLDEQFGFLNSTQLETVRIMMKLGDVTGANRIAMDAFTKQMKAAEDAGKSAASEIGKAFKNYVGWELDNLSNMEIVQWLMKKAGGLAEGVNNRPQGSALDNANKELARLTGLRRTTGRITLDEINDAQNAVNRAAADEELNRQTRRIQMAEALRQKEDDAASAIKTQNGAYQTQLEIATKVNIERARAEAFERYKSSNPHGLTNTPGGVQALTDWATKMAAADPSVAAAVGAQTLQDRGIQRQIDAEKSLSAASFEGARAMSLARAAAAAREAEAQGQNKTLAYAASLAKDQAAAMQTLGGEYVRLTDQERFLADAKSKGFVQASIELKMRQLGISASKEIAENIRKEIAEKERLNEAENAMLRGKVNLLGASNDNLSASERAYRIAVLEADKTLEQTRNTIDYANAITKAKIARDEMNASEGKLIRTQMNPELAYRDRLATIDQATGVSEADKLVARRLAEREYRDALIARKEAEDDWASGADRAFMKYSKSVGTVADQTERVMTNAFKSMEDALVEFAMTGELSFEKMANSIISDLIRMQIQASITKPLSDAITGAGGVGGIMSSLFSAHGNAFSAGGNVIPFAKGGVVNGVTPFRFGQGGAMSGIMGEAGPEAIVPLTRTPQGDLGIRSTGGGAQVKVEINNYGTQKEFDVEQQMGAFGPIVRIIARDEANKAVQGYAKGGGLTNQLRQDYNIRQPAVNRG